MEPAVGTNYLLGRGDLYIDRWVSGAKTGTYRFVGNVPKLEIDINDDVLEKNSSCEAAAPLVLSIVKKRTATLSISLDEYRADNVALNLMGDVTTYSQTTGAVTAESLTSSMVNGTYYRTVNRRITAITVKKGVTAAVLGTDYRVVDAEAGIIQLLTGALFTAGDAATIDYTKGTITNENKIRGGVSSFIDCSLLFVPDPANGPKEEIEVWHAQINTDGTLPIINPDDTGQFAIKAKVISDATNHSTEPYFVIRPRP